jgi:hypothetical protein
MFEDWKQAWRQAVENFQRELAEDTPAAAGPRVRAMERELTSAAGALARLEEEIRRTRREAATEREAEEVCRRRERLARDAGDEETVRVAIEFAARHAERAAVLQRKAEVLEDERSLLQRDMDGMRRVIAEAPPAAGAAASANAGARADPLDDPASPRRATDHDFSRLEHDARDRAAAARLEELKRRMRG